MRPTPFLHSSGRNQTDEPQLKEKEAKVRHVEDEEEGNNPDWVNSFRTRPTWKRLACMVCGPDDSLNLTLPRLGKRSMEQQEDTAEVEFEEQVQKRSKLAEECSQNSTSARVSIHPR